MRDPFGSMQAFVNQFQQFRRNPAQFISGIPAQFQQDPRGAIQYLMNTGRLSQDQYNQAARLARQIQDNPQFRQLFGGM